MKVAVTAVLAGLMLTVAIVAAVSPPDRPRPVATEAHSQDPAAAELQRCRTAVEPDPSCAAAWAARQRRFFGNESVDR